jgi:hypothetical protein
MDTPNALTIFAITCRASWFFLLPLFVKRSANLAGLSGTLFALFLTFGEQGLLAVKNRDLDEIRKKVGRRSEERRAIPRA